MIITVIAPESGVREKFRLPTTRATIAATESAIIGPSIGIISTIPEKIARIKANLSFRIESATKIISDTIKIKNTCPRK